MIFLNIASNFFVVFFFLEWCCCCRNAEKAAKKDKKESISENDTILPTEDKQHPKKDNFVSCCKVIDFVNMFLAFFGFGIVVILIIIYFLAIFAGANVYALSSATVTLIVSVIATALGNAIPRFIYRKKLN